MYFCYLDESGGCERPDLGPAATPAMFIVGLILEASQIPALTRDFLAFKRRFFPGRYVQGHALDHVLTELKGSEILQMTRSDSRNKRRQADLLRSRLLDLVETYRSRVVGRVWVKEAGKSLKPEATYCYAVQDISLHFSQYLLAENAQGLLIADGRSQHTSTCRSRTRCSPRSGVPVETRIRRSWKFPCSHTATTTSACSLPT